MSSQQETIARIAGLARTGKLDEASLLAARAFADSPADPVLAALAGAVEYHRGQHARAVPYLEAAHRLRPQDLTVRGSLAESLFHTGRNADALALCDDEAARADPTLRLARLGAHLAQEAEEWDRSVRLYRLVLAKDKADWAAWNNLGNALTGAGDHTAAADALEQAARLAPDSPPIRLNLGNALIEAGRYEEAESTLQDLAAEFPDDPQPQLSLFAFYRRAGLEERALEAIAEAARRAPDNAEIQSDHGQAASQLNEYAAAEAAFEASLAIAPSLSPPLAGLAALYERTNREAELDPLRERAVAAAAAGETVAFIDALRFKRAEDFDAAFDALERAGEVAVPVRKHHLRGTMLDRLGRHDEAFAEFSAMNALWKEDPSRPEERAAVYRDVVAKGRELLTPEWVAGWTKFDVPLDRPTPVFLLGFPRSGTTLLDTMLMADPSVSVLEEERFLPDIEHELGGIEALPALSPERLLEARVSYFERVGEVVDLKPASLVIDKHPLHLNKLPVIQRLFPDARYILALRHPMDVLLSCYITNFRTNHAMSNFLELETAAELYDASFSYWEQARAVFQPPVRTVIYERLVEDKTRELRPLFDWLGLDWPGEGHDHREAARARGVVRTASYAQVTEPIYKRAAGRWQRYEKHLAPIAGRLRPWVEKFGYSLADGRYPDWPDAPA